MSGYYVFFALTSILKKPFTDNKLIAFFFLLWSRLMDRAGHDYWAKGWDGATMPPLYDLARPSLNAWGDYQYLKAMRDSSIIKEASHLLEIGCGNSAWLPYFKNYFGTHITGIDYTDTGCATSRAILDYYNVVGEVIKADLFSPPAAMIKKFDIVFSNGVIEHFDNTADCIRHCAAFLADNGYMISFIPNMTGLMGRLQKLIDRSVFDIHVLLDYKSLKSAHEEAGLEIVQGGYLLPANFNMVNTFSHDNKFWHRPLRRFFSALSKLAALLDKRGLPLPANKYLSSHIYVIARKAR